MKSNRENSVDEILSGYLKQINDTPALISLLYDADMLPEQIISVRGAISVAAVVTAYNAGRDAAPDKEPQIHPDHAFTPCSGDK